MRNNRNVYNSSRKIRLYRVLANLKPLTGLLSIFFLVISLGGNDPAFIVERNCLCVGFCLFWAAGIFADTELEALERKMKRKRRMEERLEIGRYVSQRPFMGTVPPSPDLQKIKENKKRKLLKPEKIIKPGKKSLKRMVDV